MARIRTIKPEFFRHEALFEAERKSGLPLRLAFIGLWTAADRDGRFKWRPRQLKLDVLPYDEVDFVAVLDALVSGGFIMKYVIGDDVFGAIPSWSRHQVINNREAASTLPAPRVDACATRAGRVPDACGTPLVHAQGEGEGDGEGEKPSASSPVATPNTSSTIRCPYQKIVDAYHELLPELADVKLMNEGRQRALRKRWAWVFSSYKSDGTRRATTPDEALTWFRGYFERATLNDFIMGRTPRSAEHANWRCDLDYLLTDKGLKQVIEKTQDAA